MLWWWVLDWAQDGDISKYHDIDIADAVNFEGEPRVLMRALIDAGYIVETQSGREIANWFKIGGQIIESKKKDAERKAEAREKKRIKKGGLSDVQGKSVGHPPDKLGISEGVPTEVHSIDRDLDLDKDLDLNKDSKIYGDADPKSDSKANADQNPKQDPHAGPTAEKVSEPGKPPKPSEKGSRKKPFYEPDSPFLMMATYLKAKIDELSAMQGVDLAPKANLQSWANEIRLMEEQNKHTDRTLTRALMEWLPSHEFWRRNVLSAAAFRAQYPKLVLAMNESKKPAGGNKGSGGRGGYSGKVEIPIVKDDGQAGTVTDEEFAEMMAKAAEIKANKQGPAGR